MLLSPRRPLLLVGALLAVGVTVLTGPAGGASAATTAPPRGTTYDGGLLGTLYDQATTIEAFSSPVVGNVAGHTDGDVDVVAGYPDGSLHVWSARSGRQEFVVRTLGAIQASPTIFRVPGGPLAVVSSNTQGEVFAYTFTGGVARRTFYKKVTKTGNPSVNGFFGTATVADLDHNGRQWIVASSWDQRLYVWDLAGNTKPGFPFWAKDTIWSSPVVATLDGDAYPSIVFGYDCFGVSGQDCYRDYRKGGGYVTVLGHTGVVRPGWPRFLAGETVWSTPAVADLFGNGRKEIVVGTGLFFKDDSTHPTAGHQVLGFDSAGRTLPGFPIAVTSRTFSSPAIGDVLGLGTPQIAIGLENGTTGLFDSTGHRRWQKCTSYLGTTCVGSHASPAIADVFGTGRQQVVAVGGNDFHILDAAGTDIAHAVIPETLVGLAATPTLVNIDGTAKILFALMAKDTDPNKRRAKVITYTLPNALGKSAWPMFKANLTRTGSGLPYVPNALHF